MTVPPSSNEATSLRTRMCGTLRSSDVGSTVTVCGWVAKRREHGEHLAFIDVRDHTGIVQCVIPGTVDVRSEYVIAVEGKVGLRPEGTANPDLPTGQVELRECTVTVLNSAASTRLAIASSIWTGRSLWRFGHFFQEPVRQPSFHIFVARKIYETHAKNNIALTRNSIAGGLRCYTIPSCRQVVLLQAG